jgi:hypothetical protein
MTAAGISLFKKGAAPTVSPKTPAPATMSSKKTGTSTIQNLNASFGKGISEYENAKAFTTPLPSVQQQSLASTAAPTTDNGDGQAPDPDTMVASKSPFLVIPPSESHPAVTPALRKAQGGEPSRLTQVHACTSTVTPTTVGMMPRGFKTSGQSAGATYDRAKGPAAVTPLQRQLDQAAQHPQKESVATEDICRASGTSKMAGSGAAGESMESSNAPSATKGDSFEDVHQDFSKILRDFRDQGSHYQDDLLNAMVSIDAATSILLSLEADSLDLLGDMQDLDADVSSSIRALGNQGTFTK